MQASCIFFGRQKGLVVLAPENYEKYFRMIATYACTILGSHRGGKGPRKTLAELAGYVPCLQPTYC